MNEYSKLAREFFREDEPIYYTPLEMLKHMVPAEEALANPKFINTNNQ